MLKRFFEFIPFFDNNDPDFSEYTFTYQQTLITLIQDLEKIHSVALKLQEDIVNLLDVRDFLDELLLIYPEIKTHLSPDAAIEENPQL